MDRKELTDLLVTSSENYHQIKFIPWWTVDSGQSGRSILDGETIRGAEGILAEYSKEDLLAPVGSLGLTLFHLLVLHNFYHAVDTMLCDGRITDVNLPDCSGNGITPFLLACSLGNLSMARLLLDHGADDKAGGQRGMNAYHFLAYPKFQGQPAYDVSCLERSALQRAGIARLLTCGINQKNAAGLTPLEQMLSVENNSRYTWPLAEVFLEKGAGTDYVDKDGSTLLMMAMNHGHMTAAFQLIRRCPELLNVKNNDGETPIQYASMYQEEALFFALTEHGAAPAENVKPLHRTPIDLDTLSEIAWHSFDRLSGESGDGLDLALYVAETLIRQVDPDDDEEMEKAAEITGQALRFDKEARILDFCRDAGLQFTRPFDCQGRATCLRDECLGTGCRIHTLRKLAELGVDLDSAAAYGRTPANILASDDRREEARERLYEEAAALFSKESMEQANNKGQAAIHLAVKYGHTGMLKTMLEKGTDTNITQDAPAEAGLSPLHLACLYGRADAVRLLIAAGADDTMKTLKGETPAHLVLKQRRDMLPELNTAQKAEILKELRHLDVPGEDGRTPLMLLSYADRELLPVFLDKGVDVNHADESGMTALMLSTDKDTVKALLRAGADLNKADADGNTVLHHMLLRGAEGEARYLIKKGADYNRPNSQGRTPAQIAAEKGLEAVLVLMTDLK